MKKVLINISLSTLSIFFLLILCEVAFRFIPNQEKDKKDWSDRPEFYYDPPGAINHTGQNHLAKKPEGVYRVAVLGDSYSFAPFMQYDDAFSKKLERMLNINSSGKKVEVINYGISGYSTTHEVDLAKRAIAEQADLVILQITLNDAELKPFRPKGVIISVNKYGAYEVKPDTSKIVRSSKFLTFLASRLHALRSKNEYKNYFFDLFLGNGDRPRTIFKNALFEISDICEKSKIPFVATIFPLFGVEINENYPFTPIHELISSYLNEKNIKHLDLKSIYSGIPTLRLQVIPGVDFHPNEIAHRMAAEAIYKWLVKEKVLPNTLVIENIYKQRNKVDPEAKDRISSDFS